MKRNIITMGLLLTLFMTSVVAVIKQANADPHHNTYNEPPVVNNYETTNVYPVETVFITDEETPSVCCENYTGVALGIANAQLNFDWGTDKFQAGVGLGNFAGENAAAFGIGKRVGSLLLNGSISQESNQTGYGVGLMTRF